MGRGGAGPRPCWRGAQQPRGLSPGRGRGQQHPHPPWHPHHCFQLLGSQRGCTLRDPTGAPTSSCIHRRESAELLGWWRCTMAPDQLIPRRCVQPTQPDSTRLAVKLVPASPQEGCGMQNTGCGTPAPSSSPAPRLGTAVLTCNGGMDSGVPPGTRSQRGWKHKPLEKSGLQRRMYSHIFFKKQEPLSPFVRLSSGEGSVGKAGRGAGRFSKKGASVSPSCPKSHP